MGWTAGADQNTGTVITASIWNNYLGATGSLEYLKTEADKLDDSSQTDVSGSRSLDGTVYQNTSGKIRIVLITIILDASTEETVRFYVENDATPAIEIGRVHHTAGAGGQAYVPITFIVPSGWYYAANIMAGTPTVSDWFEYDLH